MKIPVLIPNIFNHPFTYDTNLKLNVGDYVKVPFGKSEITGVVWNEFEKENKKKFKIKNINIKLEIEPLKIETIKFLNWFSEYNLIPKGMSLKLHLLSGEAIKSFNEFDYEKYTKNNKSHKFELSKEQKKVLKDLSKNTKKFRVHLLQGTTGSGKTIVYFNSIKSKLNKGFQALILLPEIGLTGEFEKKFCEVFGFNAAVLHSAITPKRKKTLCVSQNSICKIK